MCMEAESPFPATRWSLIRKAGDSGRTPEAEDALNALCQTYWRPLYAFARWWGASAEEAPDLVQGFLSEFIGRGDFGRATPEKGRFRSYLRAAFEHHLIGERRREQSAKRGGGCVFLSLEEARDEEAWLARTDAGADPQQAYDRRWAQDVLRVALDRVKEDYERAGNDKACTVLLPALMQRSDDFATLGEQLGVSAGGARSAMHRMRLKLREALRWEVSQTVESPGDAEDEMRYLLKLLAG